MKPARQAAPGKNVFGSGKWRICTVASLLALTALLAIILVPGLTAGSVPLFGSAGFATMQQAAPAPKPAPKAKAPIVPRVGYAGVRSSAYGIKPFPSPEGWGKAIKTMGSYFPEATPFAIWIVGRLNGKIQGTTMEFPRPSDGKQYGEHFAFEEVDKHEPYLKYFDENGIKVFLQVEPGFADVGQCIDLCLSRYKQHPSVIGWGIDVEWFENARTGSPNAPASDYIVHGWNARVKSHNPQYRLFVKHYQIPSFPQLYRSDVIFIVNTQNLRTFANCIVRFKEFADFFYPNPILFQIGYPRDKPWWSVLPAPIPKTIGENLTSVIRQETGFAWVDFGLRDVLPAE